MKLLSTYSKEMKIAFRGFYFYIEIVVALILLVILLVAIDTDPDSKYKEFLYYDMPEEVYDYLSAKDIEEGKVIDIEDAEFQVKPAKFELTNMETGEITAYTFNDEKTIITEAKQQIDPETGKVMKTLYRTDNEEDMLRLSYETGKIGATTTMSDTGEFTYRYMLQGYETERFSNVLYILHTLSPDEIDAQMDKQVFRELGSTDRLNNREAVVPVFVAFAGSLMGFFIIMSYVFLDKDEGVIRAFAVTPSAVWKYLLSKTFVILTTVVISSSIIVIPVMGLKPNYLLFYIFLLITTFAFAALGLLIASFFNSISKAFGVLYLIMIAFMLPGFSYYISSFDPLWLRFFPTYPVLQGFKGILLGNPDVLYVVTYSVAFLLGGAILLSLANARFKKTLTV